MRTTRTLHPIAWFVAAMSLLWLISAVAPKVFPTVWYPGYPFFMAWHIFGDLLIFLPQYHHFHQPDFYTVNTYPLTYPAPADLLLGALFIGGHPVRSFSVLLVAGCIAGLLLLAIALVRHGMSRVLATALVVFLAVTSYPLYFCLLRANIEFFNCLLMAVGIALCCTKRWNRGGAALGIAVALKLYPVILLGFLLAQRKFRALGIALATAAATTLVSLRILGPSIGEANREIARGLQFFKTYYVVRLSRDSSRFDHSIFGAYKVLAYDRHPRLLFDVAAGHYSLLVLVLGLLLYFGRVVRLPALSQVVVLTTLAVLLPPTSYDYTLLILYIPWTLLAMASLRANGGAEERRTLVLSFLCMAWAMAPITYFGTAASPLKCLGLVLLVVLHCVKPIGQTPVAA